MQRRGRGSPRCPRWTNCRRLVGPRSDLAESCSCGKAVASLDAYGQGVASSTSDNAAAGPGAVLSRAPGLSPGRGAVSAAKGLSKVDGFARRTPADPDRCPLDQRGGRAAGHPSLDRARTRPSRRPSCETGRAAVVVPARSARRGNHAARRSGRLEASRRRLKSLERYSTALLRHDHDDTAKSAETKKSPPSQGSLETRATGLEPATSGVTGRRSNHLNYARVRDRG
jgi:hypothetical protein